MPPDVAGVEGAALDAACDDVERYFGDLIDSVAIEHPVSRTMLVETVAILSLAADRNGLLEGGTVRALYDAELVVTLSESKWGAIPIDYDISDHRLAAVRDLHARMGEALLGVDKEGVFVQPLYR